MMMMIQISNYTLNVFINNYKPNILSPYLMIHSLYNSHLLCMKMEELTSILILFFGLSPLVTVRVVMSGCYSKG